MGGHAEEKLQAAESAAIAAIRLGARRLSERLAEKSLRKKVYDALPGKNEIAAGQRITVELDIPGEVASARSRLDKAIAEGDLKTLLERYPVRDSGALGAIAKELGFVNRKQYESAVRRLLMDDGEMLKFVRSLFGTLAS